MSIGDIVRFRNSVWVVFGRDNTAIPTAPIPGAYVLKRQRDDDAESQDSIVTLGPIELLHSPTFTPRMKLQYEQLPCEVVRDDSVTVRVAFARRHNLPGGNYIAWDHLESDVSRGALVLENLSALMMQT